MNIRLQKYRANRISGMNQYNAARAAKYSESYSRDHAHKLEKSVKVGICDALEQVGITDKYQSAELFKLTKATKVISCNVFIDKDGEMKQADGKSLDFVEVPDPTVRLNTWKHIADLKSQIREKPLIDNSKHFTRITVGKIDLDERIGVLLKNRCSAQL